MDISDISLEIETIESNSSTSITRRIKRDRTIVLSHDLRLNHKQITANFREILQNALQDNSGFNNNKDNIYHVSHSILPLPSLPTVHVNNNNS